MSIRIHACLISAYSKLWGRMQTHSRIVRRYAVPAGLSCAQPARLWTQLGQCLVATTFRLSLARSEGLIWGVSVNERSSRFAFDTKPSPSSRGVVQRRHGSVGHTGPNTVARIRAHVGVDVAPDDAVDAR